MEKPQNLKQIIKDKATELGFTTCGFTRAEFLSKEAAFLENWLTSGLHGNMIYMERNLEKRLNPTILVQEAKTVISLAFNYFPEKHQDDDSGYKISKYAYGIDYHYVIKNKLDLLSESLLEIEANAIVRSFVDSAPVLERTWAVRSGIGWIGKNSNLIIPHKGSFFFLCELITNLEVEFDQPYDKNGCGTCQKCMKACPTNAIIEPYRVDARKCLSYLTIENKSEVPEEFRGKSCHWIFGCDICQDVCPFNRSARPHREKELMASASILHMKKKDWEDIDSQNFNEKFGNSPMNRMGFKGLQRNLLFAKDQDPE
jgi:epoxyqueuosine reductase